MKTIPSAQEVRDQVARDKAARMALVPITTETWLHSHVARALHAVTDNSIGPLILEIPPGVQVDRLTFLEICRKTLVPLGYQLACPPAALFEEALNYNQLEIRWVPEGIYQTYEKKILLVPARHG